MADLLAVLDFLKNKVPEEGSTVESIPAEPIAEPEVPEAQEPSVSEISQPEVVNPYRKAMEEIASNHDKYKADLDKYGSTWRTINDHVARIVSMTPRGGRFAGLINDFNRGGEGKARENYKMSLDAMKNLQGQDNWEKEQDLREADLLLKVRGGQRDETKFGYEEEKLKNERDLRNRLLDMESPDTKLAQSLAIQMLPNSKAIIMKMNGAQLMDRLPSLQSNFNSQNARREADVRIGEQRAGRLATQEQKEADRAEKRGKQTRNVEERYNNIIDTVNTMQEMIRKEGTANAFGAHNDILLNLINNVATDQAKMLDADSAVRDPEVMRVMNSLFEPGNPFQRDQTAIDALEAFKATAKQRRDKAYEAQQLPVPGAGESAGKPDMVVIDTPKGRKTVPGSDVQKYLDAGAKLVK